jgi:hypothetical protein
VHQARRPILDQGARTCPDPWPSPNIVITNWAACLGSASQLEGEQNIHVPCAGSKLHAAPTTPQIASPFSSPSNTLTRENLPREGAASEWCAADICPESWEPPDLPCREGTAIERCTTEARRPETWKPPDLYDEALQESGGVLSALDNVPAIHNAPRPAAMAEDADVRHANPSSVDAHK